MNKLISIVVPCHNEASNIEELYKRIKTVFDGLDSFDFELIFCDDSDDITPEIALSMHKSDPRVKLVRLSRKFGQTIAIASGLRMASGTAAVMMDADLQDPPEAIPMMLEKWEQGYAVVYAQRQSSNNYWGYRTFSFIFYRLLKRISSVEIPVEAGEFRLVDAKVIKFMAGLSEHTRFMRGLTVWPGFKSVGIKIVRDERRSGRTNYNFSKSLVVAIDGLVGFSVLPLRLAAVIGALMMLFSFALGAFFVVYRLLEPSAFGAGWASLFVALVFFGGVQSLMLGVLGEYVGRIYTEVQGRPLYCVDYAIGFDLVGNEFLSTRSDQPQYKRGLPGSDLTNT